MPKNYSFVFFWERFTKTNNCFQNFSTELDLFEFQADANNLYLDILFSGCFIHDEISANLIRKTNAYTILFLTEPIEDFFIETKKLIEEKKFDMIFGCINEDESKNYFKYPLYLFELKESEIKEERKYKKLLKIIAKYENNEKSQNMATSLNKIYPVKLDSKENLQNYKFVLCSEKKKPTLQGFITTALYNVIKSGAIPIYDGYFDEIDEKIFNKNRIIFFDNEDGESISEACEKINYLLKNEDKLEEFYNQPVFEETALETIKYLETKLKNKLKSLSNLPLKFSDFDIQQNENDEIIKKQIKQEEEDDAIEELLEEHVENKLERNLFIKHNEFLSKKIFEEKMKEVKEKKHKIEYENEIQTVVIKKETEEYVLVLDFNNLGGGTQFFLEEIIKYYKEKQNFIILRPVNENVDVYMNNEKMMEEISKIDVFVYLLRNEKKIKKIFVNHLLKHDDNFVQNILQYFKVEKICVFHDYFLLMKKAQPLVDEIKFQKEDKVNINSFNTIIIQNKANYEFIKEYIEDEKRIIISPLPDYKEQKDLYFSKNEKIIIGLIGFISPIKGYYVVQELIEYIEKNKLNMEVVIFGRLEGYKFYEYKSIEELNELLIEKKPNVIIETSIWPETYSYTLTLGMITQLPIISLKKPYESVIENRLKDYVNVNTFETMEELINLVKELNQNYFYTIEPKVYFNKFWSQILL
jgi:hypothetical protein